MPLTDPAEDPPADEFKPLVSAREALYASLGDRWVELAEPRANQALALYSREIVHVPLGVTAASMIMFSTLEAIGAWAVAPAAAAGAAIVFTGLWAKSGLRSPGIPDSLRADVAQAHEDFRAALSALGSADTSVDVIMAVRSFEPRMDAAMGTLFDPGADQQARILATESVLAIGARTWALTTLTKRRAQMIEAALASDLGSTWDVTPATADLSLLDFTEIESVGATISRETLAIARTTDDEDVS